MTSAGQPPGGLFGFPQNFFALLFLRRLSGRRTFTEAARPAENAASPAFAYTALHAQFFSATNPQKVRQTYTNEHNNYASSDKLWLLSPARQDLDYIPVQQRLHCCKTTMGNHEQTREVGLSPNHVSTLLYFFAEHLSPKQTKQNCAELVRANVACSFKTSSLLLPACWISGLGVLTCLDSQLHGHQAVAFGKRAP